MANNQVDVTPSANLGGSQPNGIHFHGPRGESAASSTNPSDFPNVPANTTAAKAVATKVTGTQGAVIRFANPA